MGIGNPEDEALNRILGDMDGMESNKMFGDKGGNAKGVSITISVVPNGEEGAAEPDADDFPEGHDMGMCGGGCAMHKGYAKGGLVENKPADIPALPEEEDKTLPPFLRKKKKAIQDA